MVEITDKNVELITDALKLLQGNIKISEEKMIELSKIRTDDNENAVMVATRLGYIIALRELLRPLEISNFFSSEEKYEPQDYSAEYQNYKSGSDSFVVRSSDGKIINSKKLVQRKKGIYLYDIFEKNNQNQSAISIAFEGNNSEIINELHQQFMCMDDVSQNNIRFMLDKFYSIGNMSRYAEILDRIEDKTINDMELFKVVFYLSKRNFISENKNNKLFDRIMKKSSDYSILLSTVNILESSEISDDYKTNIQFMLLRRNVSFSGDYLDKLKRLNKDVLSNSNDTQIRNICSFLDNIYSFSSDEISNIIDKPISVIEAHYGKSIKEVLDEDCLSAVATKKLFESIDLFQDDERFYKLRKNGIETMNLSLFEDYSEISDENLKNIIASGINITGYNDDLLLRIFNSSFLTYLDGNSNDSFNKLQLIQFFAGCEVEKEDTIQKIWNETNNYTNQDFDFNMNVVLNRKLNEIRINKLPEHQLDNLVDKIVQGESDDSLQTTSSKRPKS